MSPRNRLAGCGILALVLAGAGCARTEPVLQPVESPAGPGSAEPNLAAGADGRVYLSWVEPEGSGHVLRFAVWEGAAWSDPQTAARGDDWFVNWADVPSVTALGNETLFAHWLAKSGSDPYAYGVRVAISADGGATWTPAVVPHRDSTDGEHGFVSMTPVGDDRMGLVWLDGREMAGGHEGDAAGAMTLRYATLDRNGVLGDETLLDARVCDCCSTTLTRTGGSLLVLYRDRSAEEIRDISRVRTEGGRWSEPAPVHRDGWKIAGCPVNGPAAAVGPDATAAAWFTTVEDRGRVRIAFSTDEGATFGEPFAIDDGNPLGRVDLVMDPGGRVVVAWLEAAAGDSAMIRIRRVTPRGPERGHGISIPTSGERASGFPQLAATGDGVLVAWTELGEASRVRTAIVR